jgi:hypothetical protein
MTHEQSVPVQWNGVYQETYVSDSVTVTTLLNQRQKYSYTELRVNPLAQGYSAAMLNNNTYAAQHTPQNEIPDWNVQQIDAGFRYDVRYVPTNGAARTRFRRITGGFSATGYLNGCVALAAARMDSTFSENDSIETFLAHYDADAIHTRQEDGDLRISAMFRNFAGGCAVKATLAYPTVFDRHRDNPHIGSRDNPITDLLGMFKELSKESHVLLVPYQTEKLSIVNDTVVVPEGNKLYVGGAGSIQFGWNGHNLTVGPEEKTSKEIQAGQRKILAEMEQDQSYGTLAGTDYDECFVE